MIGIHKLTQNLLGNKTYLEVSLDFILITKLI